MNKKGRVLRFKALFLMTIIIMVIIISNMGIVAFATGGRAINFSANQSGAKTILTLYEAMAVKSKNLVSEAESGVPTNIVNTFENSKTPLMEIHVATSGSDYTGNGSVAAPYHTIARAISEATPGTAVRIHSGIYPTRVDISNLYGIPEAPIWIGGVAGEDKPVITNASEGIHLSKVRYLIIHDIEVTATSQNGINCDDGGDFSNFDATRHVIFRNLYIHNIGSGGNEDGLKLSGVNNYYVLDSEISNCGGSHGSGIDHVGCHNGLITNNYFHDFNGNAIQCKGGSENIEIRSNRMVECGERALNIGGSTDFNYFRPPLSTTYVNFEAKNIRVNANIIKGSVASLAFVGAVDCSAINNTIITPHNWLIRILQETRTQTPYTFAACADNIIANNIFYYDGSDLSTWINIGNSTSPQTFTFSNNLWYNYTEPNKSSPNLPVPETQGIYGQNPMFIDVTTDNFSLQSSSPALAKGRYFSTLSYDYEGKPFNNAPNIGAMESSTNYVEASQSKAFTDLDESPWAVQAINAMSSKGYINGKTATTYCPQDNMTRAEVATILTKMLKVSANAEKLQFIDVPVNKWYYPFVKAAADNGIMRGKEETRFYPEAPITREELAVLIGIVLKSLGYESSGTEELNKYKDNSRISSWALELAALVSKEGIISGSNGLFRPKGYATRAEVASMLYRLLTGIESRVTSLNGHLFFSFE